MNFVKYNKRYPKGDFLLVAADPLYFTDYAPSLLQSCLENDTQLHCHIINPDTECNNIVSKVIDEPLFTFSYEIKNLEEIDVLPKEHKHYSITGGGKEHVFDTAKSYYSSRRLSIAKEFVNEGDRIFVVDMDTIVRRKPEWPSKDKTLGLYLREHNRPAHKKLLITILYATYESMDYLNKLSELISKAEVGMKWYTEQTLAYQVFKELGYNKSEKFIDMAKETTLDYRTRPEVAIWSPKGADKWEDAKFLEEKRDYEFKFQNRE